jgi:sterol 3beta-glucosyltransferase
VVHHGGIGTLSLCLLAGVPSLSCPVIYPMGDQHFWGNHAYKIGCAVKPIPLKNLKEVELYKSISEILTNQKLLDNCRNIATQLSAENGVDKAVRFIELKIARE